MAHSLGIKGDVGMIHPCLEVVSVIGGLIPKMLIHVFGVPGLFAQEADEWLGFSPMMTQALEEAYQTWLQEEPLEQRWE